jgi:hypothetical protein
VRIQWNSFKKLLAKAVKNSILNLLRNLKHVLLLNELDYYYDRLMDQKIKQAIRKNNFELFFSTRQMANYVVDMRTPKYHFAANFYYLDRRRHQTRTWLKSGFHRRLTPIE